MCVCVCVCVCVVTSKYETVIHMPSCRGRVPATDYGSEQESADDSNKQNWQ